MKLLAWITEYFIAVFGITRPRPEQERTANLLIGGFILAVVAGAFAVVGALLWMIYH